MCRNLFTANHAQKAVIRMPNRNTAPAVMASTCHVTMSNIPGCVTAA